MKLLAIFSMIIASNLAFGEGLSGDLLSRVSEQIPDLRGGGGSALHLDCAREQYVDEGVSYVCIWKTPNYGRAQTSGEFKDQLAKDVFNTVSLPVKAKAPYVEISAGDTGVVIVKSVDLICIAGNCTDQ